MRQLPRQRSLASEDELEFEAFAARDSGRLLGLAMLLLAGLICAVVAFSRH